MYSDKKIEIKITKKNIEYYINMGYDVNINETCLIKSCDVIKTVANRIYVICENCGTEKQICSYNYHNQIKKSGFYVCKDCNNIKVRLTNINKYGTPCPLQNAEIIQKSKNTLLKNYGVDNISKLDTIKEDRRENFKKDSFKNKAKISWNEKYGVDNPSKSDQIKKKKEQTCLKNYGVENPSQCKEIFEIAQINGKKIKKHILGLYYRGTYEKHFLDFCLINNIEVEKGPTIKYKMNNKIKYYHSDFYIKKLDLICEIKSSYYYNKYLELNTQKKEYSEKIHKFLFIIDKEYTELMNLFSFIHK